jgi:SAM-dependent methyltransferase
VSSKPDFGKRATVYDRLRPYDDNWREVAETMIREADLAGRRVLDIGCGTGRFLAQLAPIAKAWGADASPEMLEVARSRAGVAGLKLGTAEELPFKDGWFERATMWLVAHLVDRPRAFAEARRVLRPGGCFVFNVWDRIEVNEFPDAITTALAGVFPDDPPRFLARTPHGYHDKDAIRRDLAQGGFRAASEIVTVTETSRAASPRVAAVAFCQGTPLRNEIEARSASRLEEATAAAEQAVARRFGAGAVQGRIQAHVVTVAA